MDDIGDPWGAGAEGAGAGTEATSGVRLLLRRAPHIAAAADAHRRRIELLEWAVEELGVDRELAGQTYDVAREEGLEPAYAVELVRCGVGVCEPPPEEPDAPAHVRAGAEWLEEPLPPAEARRERIMRASFRRLRGLLEREASPEAAVVAFTEEPDVMDCEY